MLGNNCCIMYTYTKHLTVTWKHFSLKVCFHISKLTVAFLSLPMKIIGWLIGPAVVCRPERPAHIVSSVVSINAWWDNAKLYRLAESICICKDMWAVNQIRQKDTIFVYKDVLYWNHNPVFLPPCISILILRCVGSFFSAACMVMYVYI